MAASACWVDLPPRLPDRPSSGWISPPSRTSSSRERFNLQFRAEFFNILNHPNFNAPNFGGNGVVAIRRFGQFHQFELRRSGFDSRCSLRSEADPVCSEVALLSYEGSNHGRKALISSAFRPLSRASDSPARSGAVLAWEDRDHPATVACRFIPLVSLLWLAWVPSAMATEAQRPHLDREFQAAVAQYESGHFA